MSSEHDEPRPGGPLRFTRADLGLARKAARERWGVPDGLKTEVLFAAARILADDNATERAKMAASRLLLEADKVDQRERVIALQFDKFDFQARPADAPDEDDYVIDLGPEPGAEPQADRPHPPAPPAT